MAQERFIEIGVEGEEKILLGMERQEERLHGYARETVNDLARFVTADLAATVPTYTDYILRHISREPPTWFPGGVGGGGEWEAVAGIKAGTSMHPLYAEFGTGIYAGRGLIRARMDRAPASVIATGHKRLTRRQGGVITFQKLGEPRKFRWWVRGQRGQHYFYQTWRTLNVYAASRFFAAWFRP